MLVESHIEKVIYYLPYPNEDGSFQDDKSTEKDFTRPFILILKSETSEEGTFEIVSDEKDQQTLITHYHLFLTPVADIEKHDKKSGKKITVIDKGELELKEGKWCVKENHRLKIRID